MARTITLDSVLRGCSDRHFDDGIRIDTDLEPLAGPGGPVKPAVYEGGVYQEDRRWASPEDSKSTPVIVIDNVPSQANRLEDELKRNRTAVGIPELVLDLAEVSNLPPHLPRQLSSLHFPHRNADAYLRDAQHDGKDFLKTEIGRSIFGATAQTCGPLMAWFPQALLFGFWQSHLGKKRSQAKHARAWVSEIIGWNPAETKTKVLGLKSDVLNLSVDENVMFNPDDSTEWRCEKEKKASVERIKLSKIGHGQVLFKDKGEKDKGEKATAAAVSFSRVTQRATVSFAQLRRVRLGTNLGPKADSAARALLVALGLYAHVLAFGTGFPLRSGATLRPKKTVVTWLGHERDEECGALDIDSVQTLLRDAKETAMAADVPLDGWDEEPLPLTPKPNLLKVIRATWPNLDD